MALKRLTKERNMKHFAFASLATFAVAGALVGCGQDPVASAPSTVTGIARVEEPVINADAGVDLAAPETGLPDLMTVAQGRSFGTRNDPFALLAAEAAFNQAQLAERVLADFGGFSIEFQEPEIVEEDEPVFQPRPAWRLAGVVISDGIVALLDTGGGQVIEIRPGQRVGQTEWVCVSIDAERAVLRRPGNQLPREIIVNLEGPLGPMGGGGGGRPGGGGGRPGGGGAGTATPGGSRGGGGPVGDDGGAG